MYCTVQNVQKGCTEIDHLHNSKCTTIISDIAITFITLFLLEQTFNFLLHLQSSLIIESKNICQTEKS